MPSCEVFELRQGKRKCLLENELEQDVGTDCTCSCMPGYQRNATGYAMTLDKPRPPCVGE